jgi:ubiquinone/menaquinone biosynthesis C-methylase UbiE
MNIQNYSELQTFLSFPDNTFDVIFHVDVFYAWDRQSMREICAEMYRVLKPNCPVYCCMELERLRKLAAYRILSESDFHPMRYIEGIEQCSFDDIKVLI